jgi:hypothetical protein
VEKAFIIEGGELGGGSICEWENGYGRMVMGEWLSIELMDQFYR